MIAGLLLLGALQAPELLGVTCSGSPLAASVKILASTPISGVTWNRSGDELLVTIPASIPSAGLALPTPSAPVRSMAFEPANGSVNLRLSLSPGSTADARTDGTVVVITVRGSDAGNKEPTPAPDVEQLYAALFPAATDAPAPTPGGESTPSEPTASGSGSLHVGPLELAPGVMLRYIVGESTYLETPQPVHTRYLEIAPVLRVASTPDVLGGRLSGSYSPRFRAGASGIPVLDAPSHFVDAAYTRPLGPMWQLSLADQFATGTIETQIVDPGREYFFDITSFKRNMVSAGVHSAGDGRLQLGLTGSFARETLPSGSAYFSNDRLAANAELRYELGTELYLTLSYILDRVPPPPERPVAEMRAQSAQLALEGPLTPTLKGELALAYRVQRNPSAPSGGDRYDGLTFGGTLRRSFANGAELGVRAARMTQLSAFESNGFYVSTVTQGRLSLPLPSAFQLEAGTSYQWNDYRLDASGLSEPRHDRIYGWTAGLAKSFTRWCFARLDYTRERRNSNVPGFSTRTYSLSASLGIGVH